MTERVLFQRSRGKLLGVDLGEGRQHHAVRTKAGDIRGQLFEHGKTGLQKAVAAAKKVDGASVAFIGSGKEYHRRGSRSLVHGARTTTLPTDEQVHTSNDYASEKRDTERVSARQFAANFVPFEKNERLTRAGEMLMIEDRLPDIVLKFQNADGVDEEIHSTDFRGVKIINTLNAVMGEDVCDAQIMQWEEGGYPPGVTVLWVTKQHTDYLAKYADEHGIPRERLLSIDDAGAEALGAKLEEWPDMILRQTIVTKDGIVIHTEPIADQMKVPNRYAAVV